MPSPRSCEPQPRRRCRHRGGNEATDTQLPYDPRVTGHRSQLEPVLNVALSSPLGAIECFIGWFSPQPRGGGGGRPLGFGRPLPPQLTVGRRSRWGAMRQRILGSHTPPCHRRMVITTQFNVLPCCTAAQTRWGGGGVVGFLGPGESPPHPPPRTARGTAPIITVFIPGTPLHTPPPTEVCMIHSKQHRGCGSQDPGTRGHRRWKTAAFSHSARSALPVPNSSRGMAFEEGWPGHWNDTLSGLCRNQQRCRAARQQSGDKGWLGHWGGGSGLDSFLFRWYVERFKLIFFYRSAMHSPR